MCLFASAQNAERKLAFDNYHYYYTNAQEVQNCEKEKVKALNEFRDKYSKCAYRGHQLRKCTLSVSEILHNWKEDGTFVDLSESEEKIMKGKQDKINEFLTEAFNRIWKIAEEFRRGRMTEKLDKDNFMKLQKAILYYGNLEISRKNGSFRFHASCFAIPTASVNIYFCFLNKMEEVESGKSEDDDLQSVCEMLKVVALQAWTQPLRNDYTDKNVVQIDRFRNHVWWVGGNGLAFRSLIPVAAMYRSIPMVDVLSEVAQRGIGRTSQNTYKDAFWTEGCTVDGAGWGHGMQCLIWGYPISGICTALDMLVAFRNTPWECRLSTDNVETLLGFIRGSNWFYYKGYSLPFFDRTTAQYDPDRKLIRSLVLVKNLLKNWSESFNIQQLEELRCFQKDAEKYVIDMEGYGKGMYNGTRWFFNNDKLMKKNKSYHILVNMASLRCDGLESAIGFADGYNFYPADGMTLFQKRGDEYKKVVGAWDVTATPGVTAREGMDKLVPVTNWRGYCSKHNFAGAATSGNANAVAGYIFEKMNATEKEGVNDKGNNVGKNQMLYGVKAYKSYLMFGDYMLALGAGITNMNPEMEGTIRTTIDQTLHESQIIAMQDGKLIPVGKGIWPFFVEGKPVWVIQKGKFAYTVLPEYSKNASFTYEIKETEWVKRNGANTEVKDLPEQVDILRLWVDHSHSPVNDTYGYVVYAGEQIPTMELPFEVLRNDTLIQAAAYKDKSVLEAVFYNENAKLEAHGIELAVSSPCSLLIEKNEKGEQLSVADPTMNANLKEIEIIYNGKTISVKMPQGAWGGKSVTVNI